MKVKLTKDKIIEAAWELLNEEGINDFSMRKLATAVGVTVSSLYYHFPNKEGLFGELINQATGTIVYPVQENTWKERLEKYAVNILAVLKDYPHLAELLMDFPPSSPNYLKLADNLLQIIDNMAIEFEQKFYFINQYFNYILTYQIDSERFQGEPESSEPSMFTNAVPFLTHYRSQGAYQKLGSQEMFLFGLKVLLDGIEYQEKNLQK